MKVIAGVLDGVLSPVVGLVAVLLRGVLALVVWLVATVLLLVSVVLCITILLIPLGAPLFAFSIRLYGFGAQLLTGS